MLHRLLRSASPDRSRASKTRRKKDRVRDPEPHRPVAARGVEEDADDQRRAAAAEGAHHVHAAGEGAAVAAAEIHAGAPAAGHREVVAEARHAHREHCTRRQRRCAFPWMRARVRLLRIAPGCWNFRFGIDCE